MSPAGLFSLVLAGYGHVGKAFCALLREKKEAIRQRYGISVRLRAVLKSDGGWVAETDPAENILLDALAAKKGGHQPLWRAGLTVESALKASEPGILAECTPSSLQTGEPGLAHIRAALTKGWHVVTASKGPLVVAYKSLSKLARQNRVCLKFSAAAGAALPALDVGRFSLAGTDILSIEGILNGTTNFILTRMGEGMTFDQALEDARARGIAEPNPALDVEGWDTAAKLLLIANSVLGIELTIDDIRVKGITKISPRLVQDARKEQRAIKLIGQIRRAEGRYRAEVSPVSIEAGHPLYQVAGTDKGITFLTDSMGSVTITGGKSDPRGAAAALLKDIIHIVALVR